VSVNGRRFTALAVALVAVNVFFWLAATGFALPGAGILQLIGGPIVRADIAWVGPTGVQETQIDRGTIVSVSPGSITLREADGPRTIQLAPSTYIGRLRRGMRVLVAGPAGQPATTIQIEGLRR
jgi:hypothetical protein